MTMWTVKPQYNKLYIAIIGTIYVLLVAAIIVLAAIVNDWVFWIFASLTNIVVIVIGVLYFIRLFKPKIISTPLGETLSFSKETIENENSTENAESISNGENE